MALTRKVVLEATPAEVWHMVATGPGLSSWFVPHELEPRKGGRGRADFGGGTYAEGRVLVYQPGKRIVFGSERIARDVGAEPDHEPDARMEFWIAADGHDDPAEFPGGAFRGIGDVRGRRRKPGTPRTTLYFRQQGFPEEGQEVYEEGWDLYFYTLTEYFRHFRGKTALTTSALVVAPVERKEAFATVAKALGVDGDADEGDRLSLRAGRRSEVDGVVDLRMSANHIEALGVRGDTGFLRLAADESCGVALTRFEYVVDPPPDFARVREEAGELQGWLEQQFA
ncbi:MAG TPA: SRPBCC domain-containing protein [Solirubrobacteraceae bacterium]|jgi:uncharacterized protein YndB with AHSA1/START domain|nr:SRPBCC domain-containing protein [Solirubrobacteraceae bacterium]